MSMGDVVDAGLSEARLTRAVERAQAFFTDSLPRHWKAQDYARQRGLTRMVIDRYGIGHAPDDWQALLRAVDDPEAALAVGLAVDRGGQGRPYARFRNRLMFPVRDAAGELRGFIGRALASDAVPKYLNSPASALFDKGALIYGLDVASRSGSTGRLVVVEGPIDVAASWQAGVRGCVACLGTAMTPAHAAILLSHCSEIVFCFDDDAAGAAATDKALALVLPHLTGGRVARIAKLPDGLDPAELIASAGGHAWRAVIQHSAAVPDYLLDRYSGARHSGTAFDRAWALIGVMAGCRDADLVSQVVDGIRDQLGVDLRGESLRQHGLVYLGDEVAAPQQASGSSMAARDAARLALQAVVETPALLADFELTVLERLAGADPALVLLEKMREVYCNNPESPGAALLTLMDGDDYEGLRGLAAAGGRDSLALSRANFSAAVRVLRELGAPASPESKARTAPSLSLVSPGP